MKLLQNFFILPHVCVRRACANSSSVSPVNTAHSAPFLYSHVSMLAYAYKKFHFAQK